MSQRKRLADVQRYSAKRLRFFLDLWSVCRYRWWRRRRWRFDTYSYADESCESNPDHNRHSRQYSSLAALDALQRRRRGDIQRRRLHLHSGTYIRTRLGAAKCSGTLETGVVTSFLVPVHVGLGKLIPDDSTGQAQDPSTV